jgi:4-hydroxythreonine-4-phosphate dehydrogenase
MSKKRAPAIRVRKTEPSLRETGLLAISIGCPSGIGPEVAVAAAARTQTELPRVLVGDEQTLLDAADLVGVPRRRLKRWTGQPAGPGIYLAPCGPALKASDRRPGRPSARAGAAQLAYIEAAYALAKQTQGSALVTGPVSKAAIARSGLTRARSFIGHTEWLQALDDAAVAVMCFASERLVTSLATTHLPLGSVARRLSSKVVSDATLWLGRLVQGLGVAKPRLAVCALNPHAGESELLGNEERRFIVPGARAAARALGARVRIDVPVGAETAYRKAYAGLYDGVVAMYHDQATIPMKLVAFGDAVNVTMGLSITRTSVDHGTGYDIAWQGTADAGGMSAALRLATRLVAAR